MYETGSNDLATGYIMGRENNGNNSGWGFGNGDWIWAIIILALLGNGGWGLGGFGGGFGIPFAPFYPFGFGGFGGGCGSNCATQADLSAGFASNATLNGLNDLKLGQAGIQQTLCQGFNGVQQTVMQGFNGVDNAVCTLGYNLQGGFNQISHQISDCCCTTQRAIDSVKYENAKNTCDIIRAGQDNTRAILDFLTTDKISTLTAENQALKFQASQTAQNAYIGATVDAGIAEIIRRTGHDCPIPAYITPNPNCCYNYGVYPVNNGCCGASVQ